MKTSLTYFCYKVNEDYDKLSLSKSTKLGVLLTNLRLVILLIASLALLGCNKKEKDLYKGLSPDQIYAQGTKNMAKENYVDAIKDFEALEARDPYGPRSHEAQLALITAYYKRNESALALSAADRFIRMNPRDPKVDYAYYLKGLVNFDQNTTFLYRHLPLDRAARDPSSAQESFDAFKELIERFPKSEYVADARQRMLHLREQLAQHELQVIDYYMKRGAYVSAVNRANYIVKHLGQTSAVPKALRAMVLAYRKLGMTQLANEAQHTLKNNFPKSSELRGL